jgi:C1A family cysteine protease
MINTLHRYAWLPDIPDSRDFLYRAVRPRLRLPQSVDLRVTCSPVEDQGQLGSCTANALAGNVEFLDLSADHQYTDVSRLFIYYNERTIEHTTASDSGAMLRDGIKTLAKSGVCAEKAWPYKVAQFAKKPSATCYADGLKRKITTYHRIQTLNEMLACLADGFPFVFGFTVYESFESAKVARTGVMPMPKKTERTLGGHAVMAAGYSLKDKRLIVRNSWGEGWGQKGYFTMPFNYAETLAQDFWTIRK